MVSNTQNLPMHGQYVTIVLDQISVHLEYDYLRLGQGTLKELGHGLILSISDYRPCLIQIFACVWAYLQTKQGFFPRCLLDIGQIALQKGIS